MCWLRPGGGGVTPRLPSDRGGDRALPALAVPVRVAEAVGRGVGAAWLGEAGRRKPPSGPGRFLCAERCERGTRVPGVKPGSVGRSCSGDLAERLTGPLETVVTASGLGRASGTPVSKQFGSLTLISKQFGSTIQLVI